jgi:hypothetical protein
MRLVDRTAAMLEALTAADIAELPPAERRRFADICRRCAGLAEPRGANPPKAGVLSDLQQGQRGE